MKKSSAINSFVALALSLTACSSAQKTDNANFRTISVTSTCDGESYQREFEVPKGFQSTVFRGSWRKGDIYSNTSALQCHDGRTQLNDALAPKPSIRAPASLNQFCQRGKPIRRVAAVIDVQIPEIQVSENSYRRTSYDRLLRRLIDDKIRMFFYEAAFESEARITKRQPTSKKSDLGDAFALAWPAASNVTNQIQVDAINDLEGKEEHFLTLLSPMIYLESGQDRYQSIWPKAHSLSLEPRSRSGLFSVSNYEKLEHTGNASANVVGFKGVFAAGSSFQIGDQSFKSLLKSEPSNFSALMRSYVPYLPLEKLQEKKLKPTNFGWKLDPSTNEYFSCVECATQESGYSNLYIVWQNYVKHFSTVKKAQTDNPRKLRYQVELDTSQFCANAVPIETKESLEDL